MRKSGESNIKSKEIDVRTKLEQPKARYYQRMLNDGHLNPRNFWNAIKAVYLSEKKVLRATMRNQISKKVEKFADYFANICAMKLKSSAILIMNFIWRYNITQLL